MSFVVQTALILTKRCQISWMYITNLTQIMAMNPVNLRWQCLCLTCKSHSFPFISLNFFPPVCVPHTPNWWETKLPIIIPTCRSRWDCLWLNLGFPIMVPPCRAAMRSYIPKFGKAYQHAFKSFHTCSGKKKKTFPQLSIHGFTMVLWCFKIWIVKISQ